MALEAIASPLWALCSWGCGLLGGNCMVAMFLSCAGKWMAVCCRTMRLRRVLIVCALIKDGTCLMLAPFTREGAFMILMVMLKLMAVVVDALVQEQLRCLA